MDRDCRRRCKEIGRNGNPGAVGSKYATGFAGMDSREEAIISQGGSEVGWWLHYG